MLIHREGWQYSNKSPAFFSGQSGCACCAPIPPPPPPPSVAYYYRGARCKCVWCGDPNNAPCAWSVEIEGFENGPQSGSCDSGTTCANNNGTFILQKAGYELGCQYVSPMFLTTTFFPSSSGCATCNSSALAYYELNAISYLGVSIAWSLRLYDATSRFTICEWIYVLPFDGYECMVPRVLTLATAYYSNGLDVCCKNAPSFVTITPL